MYLFIYLQLSNAVEKQRELQQQYEEEKKIRTDVVLATTTEPRHTNSYVHIYINCKFFI